MVKKETSKTTAKNSMMKAPTMGTKSMPNIKSMMMQEAKIEKKTVGKQKTAAEKKLEQKISKQTGKAYKGKR